MKINITQRTSRLLRYLTAGALALGLTATAHAQGTGFTYQGRLDSGGVPYSGTAEFQPTLWNVVDSGTQLAANSPAQWVVTVTNGLFELPLDFGANFPGSDRWLQLEVRTAIGPFTALAPRQKLTATPYALHATTAGSVPASGLTGTVPNANLPSSPTFTGTVQAAQFQGGGAGLTGLDAAQVTTGTLSDSQLPASVVRTNQVWLLGGNAGTTAGVQFLGTTGDQPLELRVNNQRGLRLEPTDTDDTVNVIGGSARNSVGVGVVGATIGGGVQNTIQTKTIFATIGGGALNTIQTNANCATIGGGYGNTIQTNAAYATIGGGCANTIQTNANCATIGGGSGNTIQTNAAYATIGGGSGNTIQTSAAYATIPGGRDNDATNYAFAAGNHARALHAGAFVWSDGIGTDTVSTNANSVTFRARGGYRLFSSSASAGVSLAAGSGTWTSMSDRNTKENFEAVNPREVLDKVAALPVSRWNYKTQPANVRHVGPMAQDFQAAFAVGESDIGITTVDADGVALAAIQGLNEVVKEKDAEIQALKARLDRLEQIINTRNGGGQ